MGILRLYLALCVVASHTNRIAFIPMHSGDQAVQAFFMVSGFYMELVYGKYPSAGAFYRSRAQRIFFPYWTILALILVVSLVLGWGFGNWGEITPCLDANQRNSPGGAWLAGISNFTVFGQDAVYFLNAEPGRGLAFTPDFRASGHPLWYLLVIPQAWSVSVELMFYLLMPLLTRLKSAWLAGGIALSLAARFLTYSAIGWSGDPWSYRFLPFELCFFMLGMLACRFWRANRPGLEKRLGFLSGPRGRSTLARAAGVLAVCLTLKAGVATATRWIGHDNATLLFNLGWLVLLPPLFTISASDRLDREVGELSYPIYLVHYFLISLLMLALGRPDLTLFCNELGKSDFPAATGTIMAALSILVSWALNRGLFNRFEEMRHSGLKVKASTKVRAGAL